MTIHCCQNIKELFVLAHHPDSKREKASVAISIILSVVLLAITTLTLSGALHLQNLNWIVLGLGAGIGLSYFLGGLKDREVGLVKEGIPTTIIVILAILASVGKVSISGLCIGSIVTLVAAPILFYSF